MCAAGKYRRPTNEQETNEAMPQLRHRSMAAKVNNHCRNGRRHGEGPMATAVTIRFRARFASQAQMAKKQQVGNRHPALEGEVESSNVQGIVHLSFLVLRCFVWVVRKLVDGDNSRSREAKKPRIQGARRRTRGWFYLLARTFQRQSVPPPCPP
jgi:hypothetical protein